MGWNNYCVAFFHKEKSGKNDCHNNRLCAVLYIKNSMQMLPLDVYMPCNNTCHHDDCIDILIDVLFYRYNHSHVVFGGDMRVKLVQT